MNETNFLKNLKIEDISRAYRGIPGCMCGCIGNYFSDEKTIKRIFNKMKKHGKDFRIALNNYVYCEIGTRCYCLYLKTKCEVFNDATNN